MSRKLTKENKLEIIRHSTSHVLAVAVLDMFPEAKFGIGPAIDNGFYYDFGLPRTLIPEDLPILEEKMKRIIKKNHPFEKRVMKTKDAIDHFKKAQQPYKVELIEDLQQEGKKEVVVYKTGSFIDLCTGPHLESTGEIDVSAIKLTKISGAYWKGDENRDQLQRVYGVAFTNKKELKQYLHMMKEAKKRDHKKLGKELDLYVNSDLVGKGLPLLTPKGTAIWQELEKFIIEEENKRGYLRTITPDLAKVDLYKKSGHWDHYRESMYPAINIAGEDYVLRPMTCPHQLMIYNSRLRSYRDLPIRYAELAKLYRREQSGELSGLLRVMSFTLADGHIICKPDQVGDEFRSAVELVQHVMKTLGIKDFWYRFSKWDPSDKKKYVNNPDAWEKTQKIMKENINELKLKYVEVDGEAAFYGPKLDVQMRNVYGKEDTAFTIQIDFDLPTKFEMSYIDEKGKKQTPMIIHRSSVGAIERTMAFLIEHYAGAFPTWLSPMQVAVIPVSEKVDEYAKKVKIELISAEVRVEMYDSDDSLGKRIAEATKQKIPYMLVIGEKEEKKGTVAVREREGKKQDVMKLEKFIDKIRKEIEKKL